MNKLEMNNTYLGFTDNKTPLQKARAEKCLDVRIRVGNKITTRKDEILDSLRNGKEPEVVEETKCNGTIQKMYRMVWGNLYFDITKTEYDFANYLIEQNLISEKDVNAYIDLEKIKKEEKEESERKAIEETEREQERMKKEKEEFECWTENMAKTYIGTEKGNLMEKIYIDKFGRFVNPIGAFMLLVYIDNIDCKPLSREGLKECLHTGNKASRKTFECVTGLKLPKTNNETMEFLDNLKKSDYKGIVEYKTRKKGDSSKNQESEVYILEVTKDGVLEYNKILGCKMKIAGIECFTHKSNDGKGTVVSITECGMRIASGKTKKEAIAAARKILEETGIEKCKEVIKKYVEKYGISPLYKKC